MAVSHKLVISDDLYTKIALDNKLVTQFYLRKATEEQEKLERSGQKMDMGAVMVKMGILTDRQHQSVLNACLYREQRDYDKRFGRQCLRMALITQEKIEEALNEQKSQYMKSGAVRPMSDFLVELGAMTTEQVSTVHDGIVARDKAKKDVAKDAVRSGRNIAAGASSASLPALAAPPEKAASGKKAKAEPAKKKGPRESGESDVDDAELMDDESNLDDVDLDDDDLDDVDLDDDLDEEDEDEELDAADLDEAERELAKQGSKSSSGSRPAAGEEEGEEPKLDLGKLEKLDPSHDGAEDEEDLAEEVSEVDSEVDLDEDDLKALEEMESGDQTEEEDTSWAADAFDDRPLDKRAPSERLPQQPPAAKSTPPPPPPPPPPPTTPATPASPPAVPTAAGSARVPRWMTVGKAKKGSEEKIGKAGEPEPATAASSEPASKAEKKPGKVEKELLETAPELEPPPPPPPPPAKAAPAAKAKGPAKAGPPGSGDDILGGDVFEGNISEEGRVPPELRDAKKKTSGRAEKAGSERTKAAKTSGRNAAPKAAPPKPEAKPPEAKKTSTRAPAAKSEPELKVEAKAESKAELNKVDSKKGASGRNKIPEPKRDAVRPPSTLGDLSDLDGPGVPEMGNDSGITLELGDLTDQLDEELPKPKGKLPAGLDEAKLRRAFDKAMESAWKALLEELKKQ